MVESDPRANAVIDRILGLAEDEVAQELTRTLALFAGRHRRLTSTWLRHAELVEHRLASVPSLTDARRLLVGACLTQEYSVEGAAVFNPSMVLHPDQAGAPDGWRRFLLSLRAVGEGHHSSVVFRSGLVDAAGRLRLDERGRVSVTAEEHPTTYSRSAVEQLLVRSGLSRAETADALDGVGAEFARDALEGRVAALYLASADQPRALRVAQHLEWVASCNYAVEFDPDSSLEERVLLPRGPDERVGMEDVRLTRMVGGPESYVGTYTAFDGQRISLHLLTTDDFRRFHVRQLTGPGAANKGLAVFPRRVDGRYAALSRADRESNLLAFSDDLVHWEPGDVLHVPSGGHEVVQVGNCGPPVETEAGWLVLTHGVGPMRRYTIGAMLLDLDDPHRVLGSLDRPLLEPEGDERAGYVPNVVYSCGALSTGEALVIPYGCSDGMVRFASTPLPALLDALVG